jgi:polyhydroxyalkanoate synthase
MSPVPRRDGRDRPSAFDPGPSPHRRRSTCEHGTRGPVGATPGEVVYAENKLDLIRFDPRRERRCGVPILLVYAFINRPTILDFGPDRSVVRQFLDRGFDVYLVDWGEPSLLDTALDLDDFVVRYLANCVDVVRERTGSDRLHLFGYCTGATLAVIYAALYPERVRTLGLLAPVVNFDADRGVFGRWGREGPYDPRHLVETFGNVPGEWLALEFSLVDPVEYHVARYLRLGEHLGDDEYVARTLRRLRWGFDSVDVPGALYREFLGSLARENRLMAGRLSVGGRVVDLAALSMPILSLHARDDRFVPPAAGLPLLEAVPSGDTEAVEFPTDHVGLSIGERSHAELWPRVCEWFARRSDGSQ